MNKQQQERFNRIYNFLKTRESWTQFTITQVARSLDVRRQEIREVVKKCNLPVTFAVEKENNKYAPKSSKTAKSSSSPSSPAPGGVSDTSEPDTETPIEPDDEDLPASRPKSQQAVMKVPAYSSEAPVFLTRRHGRKGAVLSDEAKDFLLEYKDAPVTSVAKALGVSPFFVRSYYTSNQLASTQPRSPKGLTKSQLDFIHQNTHLTSHGIAFRLGVTVAQIDYLVQREKLDLPCFDYAFGSMPSPAELEIIKENLHLPVTQLRELTGFSYTTMRKVFDLHGLRSFFNRVGYPNIPSLTTEQKKYALENRQLPWRLLAFELGVTYAEVNHFLSSWGFSSVPLKPSGRVSKKDNDSSKIQPESKIFLLLHHYEPVCFLAQVVKIPKTRISELLKEPQVKGLIKSSSFLEDCKLFESFVTPALKEALIQAKENKAGFSEPKPVAPKVKQGVNPFGLSDTQLNYILKHQDQSPNKLATHLNIPVSTITSLVRSLRPEIFSAKERKVLTKV